ncbi:MAG TPA: hypothetical protein VN442_14240 [Bryobacteraceae bacterium]|nr:hypothetical protein [Bryobacteraceae bacterium]
MRVIPECGRNDDGERFCRVMAASGRAIFDIGLFFGPLSIRAASGTLERALVPFGLLWNEGKGARSVMLVMCPLIVSFMWMVKAAELSDKRG